MTPEDIDFAVQATGHLGWDLGRGDFEFMMDLEPEGCFVLLHESERIGLATTVSFSRVGWFGNLLVEEEYRKQGAGSQLVLHSIEYLRSRNVETVGVYAYLERIPFYERLGFTYDSDFVVLKGKGFSSAVKANVRKAGKQDVQDVVKYDQSCFGSSRKKLLEPIILDYDNLCYVSTGNGRISGYAVAKVYKGMAELGPLVCTREPKVVAVDLLGAVLNELEELHVSLFLPTKETLLLKMLVGFGFKESFRVARMFLDPSIGGECIILAESLERG